MLRSDAGTVPRRPGTGHPRTRVGIGPAADSGTALARHPAVGRTTPRPGGAEDETGPWLALIRLQPGLMLDELVLNLLPLVEAGVLELVVDPARRVGMERRTIVFEECPDRPDTSRAGRPAGIRMRRGEPGEKTAEARCLDASTEVPSVVREVLRRSMGVETAG